MDRLHVDQSRSQRRPCSWPRRCRAPAWPRAAAGSGACVAMLGTSRRADERARARRMRFRGWPKNAKGRYRPGPRNPRGQPRAAAHVNEAAAQYQSRSPAPPCSSPRRCRAAAWPRAAAMAGHWHAFQPVRAHGQAERDRRDRRRFTGLRQRDGAASATPPRARAGSGRDKRRHVFEGFVDVRQRT